MDFVTTGLIASLLLLTVLVLLFTYERRKGTRILGGVRTHLDFFMLRFGYALHTTFRRAGLNLVRQIGHYVFHTLLGMVLSCIKRCERGLYNVMRVNKTLAKNAERESATLSKLEEVALHKVATALSEKEKIAHKEKMLNGM